MGWLGAMGAGANGACVALAVVAAAALGMLWRQQRRQAERCRHEMQLREELEAYAQLDVSLEHAGSERALAVRVCRAVVRVSRFPRAALLLTDGRERLRVAGSAGFDDMTVDALNEWGAAATDEDHLQRREGERSFVITLRPGEEAGVMAIEDVRCRRVLVVPMEGVGGRVVGALAVCAEESRLLDGQDTVLEVLAVRLACSVESQRLLDQVGEERLLEEQSWERRRRA